MHPEWTSAQIKAQILATVDPLPSLTGLCVTGGRLNAATSLAATGITVSSPTVTEGDSGTTQMTFTVTRHGDDTGTVTLNWSTADGTAVAGSDYVAASGQVTFLPSGGNTQTITVSIQGDLTAEVKETFLINLSVVSGNAVLADEQAQGLILDPDTKFYVVNDGSPDRTYEYGLTGQAGENYSLGSGNTAPRGAASTAAGTKVWVADANKTVYVYNPAGGLLGSWSAGGLSGSAQVEGIATDGTDVWLLDNKLDKVYRYTGAATRLSGSQIAASSFSLTGANSNPKGIVTDGTSLWVVDDGTAADKVFKYALTGSLLGSWTIDPANAHPTGLTVNPAAVSDIWIVDNSTLKVYQYTAAAGRTSGSQTAGATFALNPSNTNPQDIADPPAPSQLLPADPVPAPAVANAADRPPAVPVAEPDLPATETVAFGFAAPTGRPDPAAELPVEPSAALRPSAAAAPTPTEEPRAEESRPGPAAVGAYLPPAAEFDFDPIDLDAPQTDPRV
jgi:hypothetical protein